LGEPALEAEGLYSCGRALCFPRGCGALVALDGRRNCGRWMLGSGWGSHSSSFRRTRDFRPSDPELAARWALVTVTNQKGASVTLGPESDMVSIPAQLVQVTHS
jgi:hypothetical protein